MSDPDVMPDPARGAGHALIRVPGAAAAASDPRFRLTREGLDDGTLGPRGWQVADVLLQPLSAAAEGADLVLSVGPAIVDTVESGVVTLGVPAASFDEPLFWPDLPLSRGGAGNVGLAPAAAAVPPPLVNQTIGPSASAPEVLRASSPERVSPQPQAGSLSPPVIAPGRRAVLPFVLLGLVILAMATGGAWYALHRPGAVVASAPLPAPAIVAAPIPVHPPASAIVAAPVPAPSTPPAPIPAPRDCAQGSTADIVACASDPSVLAALAQRKWDAGQADQSLVLLQIAAERGSGPAALKLAQIYDPITQHGTGPGVRPDAREAAQYYRRAIQAHEDAAAAPREALRQRLQRDADNGDALAPLTLKDFWP